MIKILKHAYNMIFFNIANNIFMLLQICAVLVLASYLCNVYVVSTQMKKALSGYDSVQYVLWEPNYTFDESTGSSSANRSTGNKIDDEYLRQLNGFQKQSFYHSFYSTINDTDVQFSFVDDAISKMQLNYFTKQLKSGVWFTQYEAKNGEIPVVLFDCTGKHKISDIIMQTMYVNSDRFFSGIDENLIELELKYVVCGILDNPAILPQFNYNSYMTAEELFNVHSRDYETTDSFVGSINILEQAGMEIEYLPSLKTMLLFDKSLSEAQMQQNVNLLQNQVGGIATTGTQIMQNTQKELEDSTMVYVPLLVFSGLATLFWTKLLRTRNYFNYSSYPADFKVFNPLYSTGVR